MLRGLRRIRLRSAVRGCVRSPRAGCNVSVAHVGPRSVGPGQPAAWGRVFPFLVPTCAGGGGGWHCAVEPRRSNATPGAGLVGCCSIACALL
ncbi:hypothetical protein NDU88_005088 [Pleurodeles waltl]|uniref:Uncharacterized protein n=1 Tax=Pleurodeles waltl TaxID=8319 RepID=A0AAV7PH53_PLEWA|nr:hypothetical protein NDU88_005088 [Pleurodeles waltl]